MVQDVVLGTEWWIASGLDIVDGDKLTNLLGGSSVRVAKHICRWKESKAYRLFQERNDPVVYGPSSFIKLILHFHQLESKFAVDKIRALLVLWLKDKSI